MTDTAAGDLGSADPIERLRAVAAIAARGTLGPRGIRALLAHLGDADKRVQRRVSETLAAHADAAPEIDTQVEQSLQSAERSVRWGAAFCQGLRGRPTMAALAIWIDHLASLDRDLRWAAHDMVLTHAAALADAAIAALHAAADAGDPQRRKMSLYVLRDLGIANAASEALARAALGAAEFDVRLAGLAAYGVVATDKRQAARDLCAYLDDPDPRLQRACAAALGKLEITDADVVEALRRASQSSDAALRRAARGTLERGE